MATFTITTDVNIDLLTGKTGGDVYNINGGTLTVDQDTRYGLNNSTSAVMKTITPSASLGGNIIFKADKVRLIPYNSGSGTIPAYNTTISQGSASGLLIGVYSALNVAPTAPGSAMPASGWIKIKQWNDINYTAGALTGITATATGQDVVGWIEIVGEELGAITLNRLNNISNKLAQGAWYQIGVTDGNKATSYQIPSNGVNQYHPGVWVETATSGEYEFYSTTSDSALSTVVGTSERKGKFCWIGTDGLLRFQNDGTNSTGGYLPPAGRKIRIGNIFFTSAPAASRTQNAFNSAIGTRFRLATASAGIVDVDKISSAWNFLTLANCSQLTLTNSGFLGRIIISNCGSQLTISNIGMGQLYSEVASILTFSSCIEGGILTDIWVGRGQWAGSNNHGIYFLNSSDFTASNINSYGTSNRVGSIYPLYISGSSRIYIDGGAFQGRIWVTVASNIEIKNFKWWESSYEYNTAAGDNILLIATCTNGLFENIDVENGDMCSDVICRINTNSENVKVRNLGTYLNPVTTGLPSFNNVSVSRSTTTVTATTSTNHNLRTGIYISIWQTNITGILTTVPKQVTVINPTTFTFTCNDSGLTSGHINYVPNQQTSVTTISNSINVKVHNIHTSGIRTILYTADNTNKNIHIENVTSQDSPNIPMGVAGATNLRLDSVVAAGNPTQQSAVYGSHFYSGFRYPLTGHTLVGTGVSWTRSGSTITVNAPSHGLVNGTVIQIKNSTDPIATVSGKTRSISVTSPDYFSFTAVASGSTSGTLDYFISDSKLALQMNEPNAETASLFTINSGTPLFTGSGTWSALIAGDQATWEMERYIIGFTHIPICLPFWNIPSGNELNYRLQYDIDRGSGFSGIFKNWFLPTANGSTTSGSPTVTMTSTAGISSGDYIFGQGIPNNTKVLTVDNATTITMDTNANFTSSSQSIIFNYAPNEPTFPSTGVKFKLRITVLTASSQAIAFVYMPLSSNDTTRAALYQQDIPETQSVTITNGVSDTRIQIYDLTAAEEVSNEIVTTFPYTWTDPNPYVADREIRVRASWVDGISAKHFVDNIIGTATNDDPALSYRLNQTDDDVYVANGIDGSTITGVEILGSTIQIDIDTGSISAAELYAHEVYRLYTEEGIRGLGQTTDAIDQANYRVTGLTIKNITSPEVPLTITGGWLVDSSTGLAVTLLDMSGGSVFNAPDHIVPFATGSGVTPSDVTDIANAVQTELNDDFAAIPDVTDIATSVETAITPQLEEILSNTDATQAKIDQL